jgi:acyl-coenzyme A synthetase/AMP-(fatty) acid ligase
VDLTPPSRHDISTIMYTNGTMGEPKGVLITQKNNGVICINGLDQFLKAQNEVVECNEPKCKFFAIVQVRSICSQGPHAKCFQCADR